jgi:hypothetical protein
MVEMQIDRVSESCGPATVALNHILATTYIALDDGMQCQQEWLECMPGPYGEEFKSWLDQLIVLQKIRYLPVRAPAQLGRACAQGGLPRKDHKWVKLCSHDCVHFLVTEDIDFFDPTKKAAASATKTRLKHNLCGPMRKMIRRATGAEVICIEHVTNVV